MGEFLEGLSACVRLCCRCSHHLCVTATSTNNDLEDEYDASCGMYGTVYRLLGRQSRIVAATVVHAGVPHTWQGDL